MADAPKLLGNDTLRTAYPKINQAIDNANESLNRLATAEMNVTSAISIANAADEKVTPLSKSIYRHLSSVIKDTTSVDTEGLLKLTNVKNNSSTEIDTILVNGKKVATLLPSEYIMDNVMYTLYEKRNLKEFNFSSANMASIGTDNARAQLAIAGSYNTDINTYNIISESSKFLPEKQANFGTNPNNYIGLHSAGLLEIKVLKTDVIAAGFSWDTTGIRNYLNNLGDFVFHIRKTVSTPVNLESFVVKKGLVTISKKSTTETSLDFYTSEFEKTLETYNEKRYTAIVKNTVDVDYTDKQIRLYASFAVGECRNERCIIVQDESGAIIPHQWEDDRFVNFKFDINMGKHSDGSLKDGYIWIVDSVPIGASKKYNVFVYNTEVTTIPENISHKNEFQKTTMTTTGMTLTFNKSSKYLLDTVTVNGTSISAAMDPAYKATSTATTYLRSDANVKVKDYWFEGSGAVFKDFLVTLSYDNFFEFTLRIRLFSNGIIQLRQQFTAKRFINKSELYGVFHRLNVVTGTDTNFTAVRSPLYKGSWIKDGLIRDVHMMFAHGDIPRTSDYPDLPNYPVMAAIVENNPAAGSQKFVIGWEYQPTSTLYDIQNNEVFIAEMEMNLKGHSDPSTNERDRAFNPLLGRITNETKIKLKSDILKLISENIYNVGVHYDEIKEGSPIDYYYPALMGRLALWKMYGMYTLDQISADYKALINAKYGSGNVETMWTMYKNATFPLQHTSRAFPIAEYLRREYQTLGNQSEVTYYTDLLKAYAEVLCRSMEETGRTSLYYNNGFNSNGTAAGLRGLSMGIKLDPSNTRWVTAYNNNLVNFAKFLPFKNLATDGEGQNISIGHYIHYVTYAFFEYVQAMENMGTEPSFDPVQYPYLASSAYGAVKEQQYCIASSRRGAGHTIAYMVYLMLQEDTTSSLAQAKRLMQRLIEQNNPEGGHEHPLELWRFHQEQSYEGVVPFELQVLTEAMYHLLDQNVRTNY